ncbi:hypothetical protein NDK50_01390 [Paraburkholderia bryophila]|uniref:hypothetical protein n=1 Tax=Paraburkholderia bryophila TaxID=420952 RepID=UPI00234A8E35|nr:hypothetical protein [Paraburkholderia bryophila]WCM22059.1 hypothetical protein NDK50_01390 [Paraburkholderia bryophila]
MAGSTTPSVTARLSEEGTKEATDGKDVRPEVEKRIGSIRAEKYIARRAHSLEEPVGERLAAKTARRPLDFRLRDRFAQHALHPAPLRAQQPGNNHEQPGYASRELPDGRRCAQKRALIIRALTW